MKSKKAKMLLLWIFLILSDTAVQLFFKIGATSATSPSGLVSNRYILLGYGFTALSFIIWMQLIREVRLFIALSAATIVYITVAFGSHFLLGETISTHTVAGTVLIASGVFLLGWRNINLSSR